MQTTKFNNLNEKKLNEQELRDKKHKLIYWKEGLKDNIDNSNSGRLKILNSLCEWLYLDIKCYSPAIPVICSSILKELNQISSNNYSAYEKEEVKKTIDFLIQLIKKEKKRFDYYPHRCWLEKVENECLQILNSL